VVFSVDDKVLVKSLYASVTDAIIETWKIRHFHHFTSQQNKVSKSEVVEKVTSAAGI